MPTVEAVFRYPVKSMLGTQVEQAEVLAYGLAADRGWALVDLQTGKVASAKQGDEVRLSPAFASTPGDQA